MVAEAVALALDADHSPPRRGGPITLALYLAAFLGWVAAALCYGLWIGERGRRAAAERLAVTGNPNGPTARRLPDAPDTEERVLRQGQLAADRRFSEATIEKGIEQIMRESEAEGRVISKGDARQQVLAMLYGAAEADLDLPEISA